MNLSQEYTPARLCEVSGGWYVKWYNFNPAINDLDIVRRTFDINRIKDKDERRQTGNAYAAAINYHLKRGYNFFTDEFEVVDSVVKVTKRKKTKLDQFRNMDEALKYALKIHAKKLSSPRSLGSYSSAANMFLEYLKKQKIEVAPKDFSARMATDYHEYRLQSVAAKTANTQKGFLSQLFDILVKVESVPSNPFKAVEAAKETESEAFEPFTAEELKLIGSTLQQKHPRYLVFTMHIYYAWMRPDHIGKMQRKQYNFENDTIKITTQTSKGKRVTYKQMLPAFKAALISIGVDKLDPELYLFSKGFEAGDHAIRSSTQRSGDLWNKYIRFGLGIDKDQYGLKATGTQAYLEFNNPDTAWFQHQIEHATLATSEAYIAKRKNKKINTDDLTLPDY